MSGAPILSKAPPVPELLANPPPGTINAYGSLLKLDPQDSLFLGSHDYEVYETKLLIGICRPGDVVIDVGAMIGYYTMILARHVGEDGRVSAFEPDPANFELLTENVRLNGYSNVGCHQALVGDHTVRSRLYRAPEQYRGDGRAYGIGDRDAIEIDMVALDDVIEGPVDIVKVDVQGYEGHVLTGMRGLIERSKQLAMFVEFTPTLLCLAGTEPGDFLGEIATLGFSLFEIDEDAQEVRGCEVRGLMSRAHDESGDLWQGYTNLLCVKAQR